MILSGEKKEEYRELKPYYKSRFYNIGLLDVYGLPMLMRARIKFQNGYSKTSPSFIATVKCDIKQGKEEWGAEVGKEYYVLEILNIETEMT